MVMVMPMFVIVVVIMVVIVLLMMMTMFFVVTMLDGWRFHKGKTCGPEPNV